MGKENEPLSGCTRQRDYLPWMGRVETLVAKQIEEKNSTIHIKKFATIGPQKPAKPNLKKRKGTESVTPHKQSKLDTRGNKKKREGVKRAKKFRGETRR